MKRSNIALAITLSISALFLTACNDDDDNYTGIDTNKAYVSESNYAIDKVDNASTIKVMTYNMANVQGKTATATAMVLFPKATQPKDGYRVVVWEHGTVGVGDGCAPSKNTINPRFKILAESLLAAGYVIVAPDYEGLGTQGVHPYLNLSSEAKSALAAVKAVKEHYGAQLKGDWMSIGQSQGGHASLGTAEFANTDASYKGAVAGAPASSLGTIIQIYIDPEMNQDSNFAVSKLDQAIRARRQIDAAIAAGQMSPNDPLALAVPTIDKTAEGYAELLAYAAFASAGIKAQQPDYDLKAIFTSGAADIAELAYGRTGDDGACLSYPAPDNANGLQEKFKAGILAFLADPTHQITQYGIDLNKFKADQVVQRFLMATQPATNATVEKVIKTPVFIIQGEKDQAVLPVVTQGLFNNMKAKAADLFPQAGYDKGYKLTIVPNATHTQAIVCQNANAVDFIQTNMSAGTGIVLTDAQKDASQSPHCTGKF
ncbi:MULTISPECIES: lipase family protein [Acinetobacter]|jgi:pimeloyl-ACP methyl ester carboxylesterase|uniref:Alpha/beta hydrolase n=1 Tax=Acinetobacter pittii TaxID=48296 RepID=A0A242U2I9_ACIPI|nr:MULTISPECIES: lipase family protein [Acinetobacter]EXS25630.1 prolyl oligopeptidase family protein [Acinetobacter baumannii 573719]MBJ8472570.1 alpha/beta hydrolase [Acinetobacter pittii]MBJ8500317.1 alpha/beta hydrolase [Acinetobacter pittii]MBJ9891059.1 alpha/beta hydrolase [Acinetobacter pittii]MCU4477601.1 alpha/beta hydrolase [Acinetobacter sp. WU_MDCI_Abxd143]